MKAAPAAAAKTRGDHGLLRGGLLLALCLMASVASGEAAASASPFATRELLHQPLGPQAEKALAALAEAAEPHERELLAGHMQRVLQDMDALLGLTEAERKALELDAMSMVSASLKTWKQCVAVDLRPLLRKLGGDDDAAQAATVGTWKAEQLVPYYVVRHWTLPDRQQHWHKAVEKRLGMPRAALWQKARFDQRASMSADVDVFLQRWSDAGRAPLMEKLVENTRILQAAVPLTQDQEDDLSARLRKLLADHVAAEIEAGRDMLESLPDHVLLTYLSMKSMDLRFISPPAEELDMAWRRLVAQTAGEKAVQAWAAAMERWQHAEAVRIAALLQPSEERALAQIKEQMANTVDELMAVLELEEARRHKLDALAEKAMTATLAAARLKWLEKLAKEEKQEGTPLRHIAFELSAEHEVTECAAWQEGLKKLLSEEETLRLLQSPAVRRQGMFHALAKTAVAEIDQLLRLNARQRTALEPLVEPHMKGLMDAGTNAEWSIFTPNLIDAVRQVPEAQLQAILDEAQMAQFKNVGNGAPSGDPFAPQNPAQADAVIRDKPPVASCEESSVTQEISSYLYERTVAQRDRALRPMLPLVEDARRVLGLPPERAALLMTAAKGAVEAAMVAWREEMEQQTKVQVERATRENLETVLDSIGSVEVAVSKKSVIDQAVWRQGLEFFLSQTERETWQAAVNERQAYHVTAMALMATAEMDRLHRLGPKQRAKIEKLMTAAINNDLRFLVDGTCEEEVEHWCLSSQFVLMPLGGVDKPQLRTALTPLQWKRLQDLHLDDVERFWKHARQLPGNENPLLPPILP